MRGLILLAALAATLAHGARNDYVEARDLRLDANGVDELAIQAGAGSLSVEGDRSLDDIVVVATITVPGEEPERARRTIDEDLRLTLTTSGDRAVLEGFFEQSGWGWGDQPGVSLAVRVPERLALAIDDSSGSIEVENVRGDVEVDDGSGSISLRGVGGDVVVEDGSGGLRITDAGNDVRIVDGSGSITVNGAGGSVIVNDGSGSINVRDIGLDLIVEDDGSGGLHYSGINGRVQTDN